MTEKGLELVKRFEGFSPRPYLCPAGYWTIGYGKVLGRQWNNEWGKLVITQRQAENMLIEDLKKYEKAILPLIDVEIHDYMLDALVSFTYNVGVFAFKASTLRKRLNNYEFYECADQFLKWVYAGGRKLQGLVKRREAERALFLEGVENA